MNYLDLHDDDVLIDDDGNEFYGCDDTFKLIFLLWRNNFTMLKSLSEKKDIFKHK